MHYYKSLGIFLPGIINISDDRESFKKNHLDKRGICFDYATSAAALLSDNGYPSLLLSLKGESFFWIHAVFLYRTSSGFGALGNTPMEPLYSSVDLLVKDFKKRYGISFKEYSIVDLDKTFKHRKWIDGDKKLINGSILSHYVKVK